MSRYKALQEAPRQMQLLVRIHKLIFEIRHFCYMKKKNFNCDKAGLFEGSFFFKKD